MESEYQPNCDILIASFEQQQEQQQLQQQQQQQYQPMDANTGLVNIDTNVSNYSYSRNLTNNHNQYYYSVGVSNIIIVFFKETIINLYYLQQYQQKEDRLVDCIPHANNGNDFEVDESKSTHIKLGKARSWKRVSEQDRNTKE